MVHGSNDLLATCAMLVLRVLMFTVVCTIVVYQLYRAHSTAVAVACMVGKNYMGSMYSIIST